MKSAAGVNQFPGSVSGFSACKNPFWSRRAEFIPQIHLVGGSGGEGVQARITARRRILCGLKLRWTPGAVLKPLPGDLEALLDGVLSARVEWRRDRGIGLDLVKFRKEVLKTPPSFIVDELLR